MMKSSYTVRIPMISEIHDTCGNLWFTIIMDRDPVPPNKCEFDEYYTVFVINNRHPDGDLIILRYPDPPQRLSDFKEAERIFREYEKNYRSVVEASTRDIQKMDIFSEQTGYGKSCAKCCATCQFCRQVPVVKDWYYGITQKLECWCFDNQDTLNMDRHRQLDPMYHHFIGRVPEHDQRECLPLHPQVRPFDICDRYLPREKPLVPTPKQSMSEFVDMRIGHRLDERISSVVSAMLSADETF